jgi:hypothetical protein
MFIAMSASMNWMAGWFAITWPNAVRSSAYCWEYSKAARATPTDAAATDARV